MLARGTLVALVGPEEQDVGARVAALVALHAELPEARVDQRGRSATAPPAGRRRSAEGCAARRSPAHVADSVRGVVGTSGLRQTSRSSPSSSSTEARSVLSARRRRRSVTIPTGGNKLGSAEPPAPPARSAPRRSPAGRRARSPLSRSVATSTRPVAQLAEVIAAAGRTGAAAASMPVLRRGRGARELFGRHVAEWRCSSSTHYAPAPPRAAGEAARESPQAGRISSSRVRRCRVPRRSTAR